jgi:hypothetical protein
LTSRDPRRYRRLSFGMLLAALLGLWVGGLGH